MIVCSDMKRDKALSEETCMTIRARLSWLANIQTMAHRLAYETDRETFGLVRELNEALHRTHATLKLELIKQTSKID